MRLDNPYIGLYSRIASKLGVSRQFVGMVARGEKNSVHVLAALRAWLPDADETRTRLLIRLGELFLEVEQAEEQKRAAESEMKAISASLRNPGAEVTEVAETASPSQPSTARFVRALEYRGFASRVAKELGMARTSVSRVLKGVSRSKRVESAINAESARIEALGTPAPFARITEYCGICARIAAELGLSRSHVGLVLNGTRQSNGVEAALNAEIARIEAIA